MAETVRVVSALRRPQSLSTIDLESLETVLNDSRDVAPADKRALLQLARELKSEQHTRPVLSEASIFTLRQLLYEGGLLPVIETRLFRKPNEDAIHTPVRKQIVFDVPPRKGVSPLMYDVAAAPEEPLPLVGFEFRREQFGPPYLQIATHPYEKSALSRGAAGRYSMSVGRSDSRLDSALAAIVPFEASLNDDPSGKKMAERLRQAYEFVESAAFLKMAARPAHTIAQFVTSEVQPRRMERSPGGKLIEKFLGESLPDVFLNRAPLTPISVLFQSGGSRWFQNWVAGEGNAVKDFQAEQQRRRKLADAQYAIDLAIAKQVAQAKQYLVIAEEKFGIKFLLELNVLLGTSNKPTTPETILEVIGSLDKRKAELVDTEYQNRLRRLEASAENECPHVGLYAALRSAATLEERKQLMESLESYMEQSDDDWITCKNCKFEIMCPHVERVMRGGDFQELKADLTKYASSISTGSDRYSVFCRICSEVLFDETRRDAIVDTGGELDEELKQKLWGISMRIFAARPGSEFVQFDRPVDPRELANNISYLCQGLVLTAMGKKRNKKHAEILGIVYVYAYVFNMIVSAKEGGGASLVVDGVKPGAAPEVFAKRLLGHLVKTHALAILSSGITNPQVASQFREAYQDVRRAYGKQLVIARSAASVLVTETVLMDPFYEAMLRASTVAKKQAVKRPTNPKIAQAQFKTVVGKTIKEALEETIPKEYVPFVRSAQRGKGIVDYPPGVSPRWVYRIPAIRFYKNVWGKSLGAPQSPFLRGAAQLYQYEKVHNDAGMKKFLQALGDEIESDRRRAQLALCVGLPVERLVTYESSPRYFDSPVSDITRLYDEKGNRHEWDTLIWEVDGKEKEFPRGEVRFSGRYVDKKCSASGVRLQETHKLDAAKTLAAVRTKQRMGSLIKYYESRCPEGGLHEYTGKSCTKCGYAEGMKGEAYYKKYRETYAESIKLRTRTVPPAKPVTRIEQTRADALSAVEELRTAIPRAVQLLASAKKPVNVNRIESLGDAAGRTPADIKSGKGKSPPPEDEYDARLSIAHGYVLAFLYKYAQEHKETNPTELREKYSATHRALLKHKEYAAAYLYSISYLCHLSLTVNKKFAVDALYGILKDNEFAAVPGEFEWSIFGDAEDSRGTSRDSSEDNVQKYGPAGTAGEDVLDADDHARATETASDSQTYSASLDFVDIDEDLAEANLEG